MNYLIGYYILINLVLFLLMGWDKRCAVHRMRRIPEKTLFLLALLGGSGGGLVAMQLFRHKTRHNSFWVIFTLTLALHIVLVFAFRKYLV